jgi:16S rRNA (guanine966-N2)-methyltransferase
MRRAGRDQGFRRDATAWGITVASPSRSSSSTRLTAWALGSVPASAQAGGWIAPGATIVWEEEAPPLPPAGFELLDERRYGGTSISLMRAP